MITQSKFRINLKRNKIPITLSIIVYLHALVIGLFCFYSYTPNIEALCIGHCTLTKTQLTTLSILKNNIYVILLLLLGAPSFGLTTVFNLLINGVSFGIAVTGVLQSGIPALLSIVPHSIFEIPAIIIAGAAGFKIPYEIVRYLAGKKEQILTRQDIEEYLTLALISIILIVIAAWVEANITLKIAESMMKK